MGTNAQSDKKPVDEAVFDRLEKLIEFPTVFPLKVMGLRADDFAQQMSALITDYLPCFDPKTIEMRSSSKGNYLSVTLHLPLSSRQELEAIYRAVSAHPLVKVVL